MVLDIVTAAVLAATAVIFAWKGFSQSVMSILQWFVSAAFSLLLCGPVVKLLTAGAPGTWMMNHYSRSLGSSGSSGPLQTAAQIYNGWVSGSAEYVAEASAEDLTQISLAALTFVILLIIFRAGCFFLTRVFPRQRRSGMTGFCSTLAGLAIGTAAGLFFVLVLFTLLLGVIGLLSPSSAAAFQKALDSSLISGSVYRHNYLVHLINGLFS